MFDLCSRACCPQAVFLFDCKLELTSIASTSYICGSTLPKLQTCKRTVQVESHTRLTFELQSPAACRGELGLTKSQMEMMKRELNSTKT